MKWAYRAHIFPAMPILRVNLGYPEESLNLGPLDAIIDTGADGTLVPQSLIDAVHAPLVDQVKVRSHWGEARLVNLYTLDVGIDGVTLPAVEVVGDQGQEIILGRNVLNHLRLLLDGPKEQTELLD